MSFLTGNIQYTYARMDVQLIKLRLKMVFTDLALSITDWSDTPRTVKVFLGCLASLALLLNIVLVRLVIISSRPKPFELAPRTKPPDHVTHLLIVLGSGGHTTEMLDMLRRLPLSPQLFTYRTYVISSGDSFSALKAMEFEKAITGKGVNPSINDQSATAKGFDIITVTRAREIHQSIWTTPGSAVRCLWDCLALLRCEHSLQKDSTGKVAAPGYPDLIITNGPGTGFCVVLASVILRFCGFGGPSKVGRKGSTGKAQWQHGAQMRTIFIESWARIKTLSLTGQMLSPFVDRLLVQWPGLVKADGKAEYVGTVVA